MFIKPGSNQVLENYNILYLLFVQIMLFWLLRPLQPQGRISARDLLQQILQVGRELIDSFSVSRESLPCQL